MIGRRFVDHTEFGDVNLTVIDPAVELAAGEVYVKMDLPFGGQAWTAVERDRLLELEEVS